MVFSAISMGGFIVKQTMIQMILSVLGKNKNDCMLCCAILVRSRMKAEWGKLYSTAALCKQKLNGLVVCS